MRGSRRASRSRELHSWPPYSARVIQSGYPLVIGRAISACGGARVPAVPVGWVCKPQRGLPHLEYRFSCNLRRSKVVQVGVRSLCVSAIEGLCLETSPLVGVCKLPSAQQVALLLLMDGWLVQRRQRVLSVCIHPYNHLSLSPYRILSAASNAVCHWQRMIIMNSPLGLLSCATGCELCCCCCCKWKCNCNCRS